MAEGGANMLQMLGVDEATAAAMVAAMGSNQSGPTASDQSMNDYDSEHHPPFLISSSFALTLLIIGILSNRTDALLQTRRIPALLAS